jgi:hypothetical protein
MKTCNSCGVSKPVDQFNRKKDKYQSKCRECQKQYYKKYYDSVDKERDRLYTKNRKDKEARRKYLDAAKDVPCMDCGVKYPPFVMDFDHRDPSQKEFSVASLVTSGPLEKIVKEIEKCDVVCANCHRIRTYSPVG